MNTGWIQVAGRDVGPHYPKYVNPAAVIAVTFWTDPAQVRTATLDLVDGSKIELREPDAVSHVGRLTRGDQPDAEPEPARGCARR